jgi:hypothetical protein
VDRGISLPFRDFGPIRAGRSGDRVPVGARFFAHLQTGPGAHPACGLSFTGVVGSNTAGGMDVCLLGVLCVVRYTSLVMGRSLTQRSPIESSASVSVIRYNNSNRHVNGSARISQAEEERCRIRNIQ